MTRLNARLIVAAALFGGVFAATGCSNYRSDEEQGRSTTTSANRDMADANSMVRQFRETDPTLNKFFDSSYGYAVFPKITKGGAGIGAARGKGGVVYEQGSVIGYSEVSQVTIGAQLGGQDFAQIIFFQDRAALNQFTQGNYEFSANASAVAATSGAGAASDFSNGVAVFTMPLGGLMFEASIGGQKFKYWPR